MSSITRGMMRRMRQQIRDDKAAFKTSWKFDLMSAVYEMIGTACFLTFAYTGCKTAAHAHQSQPQIDPTSRCAASFGLSLFAFVSIFFRVTGGLFNPMVTLGLYCVGSLRLFRAVTYFIAQLVGSIIAAALVKGLVHGGAGVSIENNLQPGVSYAQGVFLEALATGALVGAVIVLAIDPLAKNTKVFAPFGIGAVLWLGHLCLIDSDGASINPARSFGPAVIDGFHSDHWVFWVGPLTGTICAVLFYEHLVSSEYWVIGNADVSTDLGYSNGVLLVRDVNSGKRTVLPMHRNPGEGVDSEHTVTVPIESPDASPVKVTVPVPTTVDGADESPEMVVKQG